MIANSEKQTLLKLLQIKQKMTKDSEPNNNQSKNKRYIKFKRLFDVSLILLSLPLILCLLLFGLILVLFGSRGPIFFIQPRVGKDNKPFNLIKLRTMVHHDLPHVDHTIEHDERIYPLGKWLRLTKIDEIPQLLNVLRGEMSIIGPRPERIEIVTKTRKLHHLYNSRHKILPGITGWAQVHNPKATPNENLDKLKYDIDYIANMNLKLDAVILLKTIKIILLRNSL